MRTIAQDRIEIITIVAFALALLVAAVLLGGSCMP